MKQRRKKIAKNKKTLTTAFGSPVAEDQASLTAGERGPVLMQDVHLLEKLGHFNRERVPERVVHAKGAGAFTLNHKAESTVSIAARGIRSDNEMRKLYE